VEFLVEVSVLWPPDGDPDELQRLTVAEAARARELAASGMIRRLWRVPGRRANWGLWEAVDATALHRGLTSLPLYPWLSIHVHPLAAHVSDPERPDGAGI
jgi:muconolactone delta-isomerase